ncbi:delta-class carbonic anhydrase [Roseobacter sinensis]|uniref:Delta-class carbonic anhydrase n=1 Tax=Roseobacter sinensis TaxID=2931391 RepID=A0ABT3BL84_9RHOB|nr:delta-class carbonic anhydrase [Roseobacter sp. WL0113]MCV3274335.1 delta-class carbonic anhydrase [Roseobacter sp. WL0113]
MKSVLNFALSISAIAAASSLVAAEATDETIAAQRAALAEATEGAGFGPQSPRDLGTLTGENDRVFATAPAHTAMNLCNIHFHENAEHRGGQFTTYAGNGDGKGAGTGFRYDGTLTEAELAPYDNIVGSGKYGDLQPGDTIEVHYVHTTALVEPGPTLGSCLSEAIVNPQLRVEAQVFVLVNDDSASDFVELTAHEVINGLHQAPGIPTDTGTPILYPGSTTGPSFNAAGSPLQVTWSVRPDVAKVSIQSVETWLADNIFDQTAAHGVRNLVTNPALLSPITETGG